MVVTQVPRLLTIKEVAVLTTIPTWRLYELIARGEGPPTMRIGRTLRVPENKLAQWIEKRTTSLPGHER